MQRFDYKLLFFFSVSYLVSAWRWESPCELWRQWNYGRGSRDQAMETVHAPRREPGMDREVPELIRKEENGQTIN